jgi:F-type H+-transporting ATPase subunit b
VGGRWTCAGSFGVALLLPWTALAAEGLNLNPHWSLVLANLAVVLLLIWPVNRLLIAPLVRILQEREARSRGTGDQAGGLRTESAAASEELEAKRNQARREAAERRAAIVGRIKADEQRLIDSARAEAAESLVQVRTSIAAEAEQVRTALRAEARALAELAAERILGRAV